MTPHTNELIKVALDPKPVKRGDWQDVVFTIGFKSSKKRLTRSAHIFCAYPTPKKEVNVISLGYIFPHPSKLIGNPEKSVKPLQIFFVLLVMVLLSGILSSNARAFDVTFNDGGTPSGLDGPVVSVPRPVTGNSGSGVGDPGQDAVVSNGVSTLTNNETVVGGAGAIGDDLVGVSGGDGGAGIKNVGATTTLTNTSNITGGSGGSFGFPNEGSGGAGINNTGTVDTLNNSGGNITGGAGGSGDSVGGNAGAGISNSGSISVLNNTTSGRIIGGAGGSASGINVGGAGGAGIANLINQTIGILTNSADIGGGSGGVGGTNSGGTGGAGGAGIDNAGTITTLTNTSSGNISGGTGGGDGNTYDGASGGAGVNNSETITTLTNTGNIGGGTGGQGHFGSGGSAGIGGAGISNSGTISTLSNGSTGSIAGGTGGQGNIDSSIGGSGGAGIVNSSSQIIGTLTNSGSITGGVGGTGGSTSGPLPGYAGGAGGAGIDNLGIITTLTNTGSISGGSGGAGGSSAPSGAAGFGINNTGGTIGTLNNLQGFGNASGALTFKGALPTNYNIIINSPTQYGQLSGTSVTGSTTFGIYTGSSVSARTYTSVLQGLSSGNLTTTAGTYSGYSWTLVNSSGTTWDLIFALLGPSAADTQQSLVNTASVLQGTYTLQNSVMVNGFTYDCSLFDKHGICVSAGGRNTTVQAQGINNTSGLLIASYRLDKNNSRIGAWVDQNLSVSGPGTVKLGNSTPMIGLFGVWSQRPDGVGAEVKVSAAYGQKDTSITRQVVGTSEPGSGGSQLISQGAQVVAKYGFAVLPDVVVSPYAGVRYTQNNMGGYTEATSSAVTAPLTYGALNTNATTALAGAEARYRGMPKTTLFASAGVETDTNTSNGSYSATGVTGLTPVNFNPNPVKTRPTATVGGYYDIMKNQRIGVTGIYRQEPFQAVSTTTVLATYTIGL